MNNELADVTSVCLKVIEPLQETINGLFNRLALKEDLKSFFETIDTRISNQISACFDNFNTELKIRDAKITTLEDEISSLIESRSHDAGKLDIIVDRLEALENARVNDNHNS